MLGLAPSETFTAFTRHDYPFFNPNISPGMNPNAAATGRPAASTEVDCAASCDAVLFNTSLLDALLSSGA